MYLTKNKKHLTKAKNINVLSSAQHSLGMLCHDVCEPEHAQALVQPEKRVIFVLFWLHVRETWQWASVFAPFLNRATSARAATQALFAARVLCGPFG
jgi:hypothetical protein